MIQVALLACLVLLAVAPVILVVSLVKFLSHRAELRNLLVSAAFLAGVFVVGWLIWRAAAPDAWPLSFWTTLKASVDSDTYGHTTEHAAEVLASKTIILGVAGGLLAAILAWAGSTKALATRAGLR